MLCKRRIGRCAWSSRANRNSERFCMISKIIANWLMWGGLFFFFSFAVTLGWVKWWMNQYLWSRKARCVQLTKAQHFAKFLNTLCSECKNKPNVRFWMFATCPSGKDPGQRGSSEENSFPKPLMYWNRQTENHLTLQLGKGKVWKKEEN